MSSRKGRLSCVRSFALLSVGVVITSCRWKLGLNKILGNAPSSLIQRSSTRYLSDGEEGENAGGEGHDGLYEAEEEISDEVVSTTVLVVFLLLIVLTIWFDIVKEHIEERAGQHLRPIIESLFGELTVLGFLSACTFVLSETGVFHVIGSRIFGADEEELIEIFELVHFALFFVMLVFVVQVLEDVREAATTDEEWMELDRACRDEKFVLELLRKKEDEERERQRKWNVFGLGWLWERVAPYVLFLPQLRSTTSAETLDDRLLFIGLKREFELERSVEPPFSPTDPHKRSVADDFNFGRYLSLCLGRKMAHVVEVDAATWACFAIIGTILYALFLAVKGDILVMAWIWVGIGYAVFFYNVYLESYLVNVRRAFAAPLRIRKNLEYVKGSLSLDHTAKDGKEEPLSMSTEWLNSVSVLENGLPGWCSIDIESYKQTRPWILRAYMDDGYIPNRQDALFWLERKGPEMHSFILRINLVFNGMYCAFLAMVFFPEMWKAHGESGALHVFIPYVMMSAVPILAILFNKKHLVLLIVQVGSVGVFRMPQVVTQTRRVEKTSRAVRRLVVFHKLHLAAKGGASHDKQRMATIQNDHKYQQLVNTSLAKELSKLFELFDDNANGMISGGEFQILMKRIGTSIDSAELPNFMKTFDFGSDSPDAVSKTDFLMWYTILLGRDDEHTIKNCAQFLYDVFDEDKSGSISVSELKRALDNLDIGFSIDEAGDILNEIDSHDKGFVGKHEVMLFLDMYYPRELLKLSDSWSKSFARTFDACTEAPLGELA